MRKFEICEPTSLEDITPMIITVTEDEIREKYFPYWTQRMKDAGKEQYICFENCLDDWIVTNWAVELKD